MILRKIGKDTRRKRDSFLFAVKKRVRGHFRHHIFHPAFYHIRKHLVQKERIGRGQFGRDLLFAVIDPQRPDHRHRLSRAAEHGGQHVGRGRFSVGARDADNFQFFRGMVVKGGGDQPHGGARIGHDELRNLQLELTFRHDGGSARFLGVPRIDVRVRFSARQTEKQVSRRAEAAVRGQPADLRIFRRLHIFGPAYDTRAPDAAGKLR